MPRPRTFTNLTRAKTINILVPGLGRGVGRAKDRFRASSGTRTKTVLDSRLAMVRELGESTSGLQHLRNVLDGRYTVAVLHAAYNAPDRKAALRALLTEHTGRLVEPLLRAFAREYTKTDAEKTLQRIERFLIHVGARGEPIPAGGTRTAREARTKVARKYLGRVTTSELTSEAVVSFLSGLMSERKNVPSGVPAAGSTKNRYRAAIGTFCTWLVKRKHLDVHPIAFKQVEKYLEPMHRLPDMTPAEYRDYFATIERARPDLVLFFKLLIHTGPDVGEVESREVRDFDLSATAPRVRYRRTKTRTPERWVPMPSALVPALRGHLAAHSLAGTALVFGMFTRRDIERTHAMAAATIGRSELRLKDLRHIAAITWRRSGEDLQTIQQRLGHATINQTTIYTDFAPVAATEAASADRAAALLTAELDVTPITRMANT